MVQYEYKVIPAPSKGQKGGDLKGAEGRFVYAIETALNELAVRGWEYLRAELLPSDERQGLTSTKTVYRTLLVFRRPLSATETSDLAPEASPEAAIEAADTRRAVDTTAPATVTATAPAHEKPSAPERVTTPVNATRSEAESSKASKDHQVARPALRAERDAKPMNEPKPGGGFLDDDDDGSSGTDENTAPSSAQQAVFLRGDRKKSD